MKLDVIYNMDCLKGMKELPDNSIDQVVTDSPYGISFMGKRWDQALPSVDIWRECLRVLKPGAFAFVMCIPRQDCLARMVVSLEDAGFVVSLTSIYWAYASGFPKAQNIGKAVDKRYKRRTEYDDLADYLEKARKMQRLSQKDMASYFLSKTGGLTGCVWNWENGENVPTQKQWVILKRILKLDNQFDWLIEQETKRWEEAKREITGRDRTRSNIDNIPFVNRGEFDRKDKPATPQAQALDGSYGGFQPKPALESILCIQKPLTSEAELTIITSQALKYVEVIVKCTNVNTVVKNTLGDMAGIVRERVTAQSIGEAKAQIGKVGGQYELTAMLESTLAKMEKDIALTHWNTGLLWKSILVDLLSQMNKFTISTITELIIELRTLNSLIFANIQENTIIPGKTLQSGLRLNVGIVESILASVLTKLLSLSQISVTGNATLNSCKSNPVTYADNVEKNSEPTIQSENTAPSNVIGHPEIRVILVAMKPLSEKTYVDQALANRHGVTWLDDCRIPYKDNIGGRPPRTPGGNTGQWKDWKGPIYQENKGGRFPSHLLVSDDALNDGRVRKTGDIFGSYKHGGGKIAYGKYGFSDHAHHADSGSFSRYFSLDAWFANKLSELPKGVQKTFPFLIVPKASKAEKNRGCEGLPLHEPRYGKNFSSSDKGTISSSKKPSSNNHPTCKPIKLMCYLITLGSRPGDIVLDPFLGSGTTAIAARMLKRHYIGYETEPDYCRIAEARIKAVQERLV